MVDRRRLNVSKELESISFGQSAKGDILPNRVAIFKVKAEEVIIELMTLTRLRDSLVLEFQIWMIFYNFF